MSNTSPLLRRLLASAALAAGMAIGLATNAAAQPSGDDFWECAADHQDTDGIGVCCVFYGGDYDERSGECWIDDAAAQTLSPEAGPTKPTVKPGLPKLNQVPRTAVTSRA